MKSLPIPEEAQIRAMLSDSVYGLTCGYVENPSHYNLKKHLTVDRSKLVEFLAAHPDMAKMYFQKHSAAEANHDVERIWQEGSEFMTAWMDHGQPRSARRFKTLPEAIAEHVLVAYGMY